MFVLRFGRSLSHIGKIRTQDGVRRAPSWNQFFKRLSANSDHGISRTMDQLEPITKQRPAAVFLSSTQRNCVRTESSLNHSVLSKISHAVFEMSSFALASKAWHCIPCFRKSLPAVRGGCCPPLSHRQCTYGIWVALFVLCDGDAWRSANKSPWRWPWRWNLSLLSVVFCWVWP